MVNVITPGLLFRGYTHWEPTLIRNGYDLDTLDVTYRGRIICRFTHLEIADTFCVRPRVWIEAKVAVFKSICDGFMELEQMLERWRNESDDYYKIED